MDPPAIDEEARRFCLFALRWLRLRGSGKALAARAGRLSLPFLYVVSILESLITEDSVVVIIVSG